MLPFRFFPIHPQYSELLSGAHRKPAIPIGTPALVCHVALWQPESVEFDRTQYHSEDEAWSKQIDLYVRGLFRLCVQNGLNPESPNTDEPVFSRAKWLFLIAGALDLKSPSFEYVANANLTKVANRSQLDSANKAIVMMFNWHAMRVILRIEKHVEYFQITTSIDLSLARPETLKNDLLATDILNALAEVNAISTKRYKAIKNQPTEGERVGPTDEERSSLAVAHACLYEKVWQEFFNAILMSNANVLGNGIIRYSLADLFPAKGNRSLGRVFADFRAVLLNHHLDEERNIDEEQFFENPGWFEPRPRWISNRHALLREQNSNVIARALWPFFTAQKDRQLEKFEFTVTRMLRNRALYVSALGAQPYPYIGGEAERNDRQFPLYYFCSLTSNSRWQTGRLIERINHLGTLRIAAFQEYDKLRDKSDALRSLSAPVDEMFSGIREQRTRSEIQEPKEFHSSPAKAASLPTSSEKLAKLDYSIAEISSWNREFKGGLTYRIERSRYYVKQFRDALPALSIRNVAGYQPYDTFVEHRLGAIYDFIDRLGIRLGRFERRLSLMYQSLAVARAAYSARRIAYLTLVAEFLFTSIAAPYYLVGLESELLRMAIRSFGWDHDKAHQFGLGFAAIICLFFWALALSRLPELKKAKRELPEQ